MSTIGTPWGRLEIPFSAIDTWYRLMPPVRLTSMAILWWESDRLVSEDAASTPCYSRILSSGLAVWATFFGNVFEIGTCRERMP